MKPHLIMPMGGAGTRFYSNGYQIPKPLMKISGKPFLYWAAMSVMKSLDISDITFIVLKQHIEENRIDETIHSFFKDAKILEIPEVLPGTVFTARRGVEDILDDAPVIFNDCDHLFKCAVLNKAFSGKTIEMDGGLLSFTSECPQYSYINYDTGGEIIGTVEKRVVSNHAICGAYIFRNAELFKSVSEEYVRDCPYNECFMSGMYNVMCAKGMKIREFALDFHVEFGTPEEYEAAKHSLYFQEFL